MMATTDDTRVMVELKFGSLEVKQRVFEYQVEAFVRKQISEMLLGMMNQREKAYEATGKLEKYADSIAKVRTFATDAHRWGFDNYVNSLIHIIPCLNRMFPSNESLLLADYRNKVLDLVGWIHQYLRKA